MVVKLMLRAMIPNDVNASCNVDNFDLRFASLPFSPARLSLSISP